MCRYGDLRTVSLLFADDVVPLVSSDAAPSEGVEVRVRWIVRSAGGVYRDVDWLWSWSLGSETGGSKHLK